MKKLNILFAGLAMLGMSSCNDFLEVDAPSTFEDSYVMSSKAEASRLLNSVYASLASSNTFGNAFLVNYDMNTDVEFYPGGTEVADMTATKNFIRQYICTPDVGAHYNTWKAAYTTIERANNFVAAATACDLYQAGDSAMLQMTGEARCMRAMNYLELVQLMGDVPFSLDRAYDMNSLVMPIENRDKILSDLIADLKVAAGEMKFARELSEGVERCSKELAWSLIARIAMVRAGYSMRPGASPSDNGVMKRADDYSLYYQVAADYCDSVMHKSGHNLNKDFYQVFIDECNYKVAQGDDPIFEIPFTKEVSGNVGYVHGPSCSAANSSGTYHPWGATSGSVRLNYFFRFTYDPQDLRREATVGYWSYTDASTGAVPAVTNNANNFCNKWSKFWDYSHQLGANVAGSTGVNWPYMRYADVLLMYAEALNEINNGPTAEAKEALRQVRNRAFRGQPDQSAKVDDYINAAADKDAFFKLIYNERAWEFAGEASRWKDLVRWNLLSKVAIEQFWKYNSYAEDHNNTDYPEFRTMPTKVYYKVSKNPNFGAENYVSGYPNNTLDIIEFFKYNDINTGDPVDNLWTGFVGDNIDLMPDDVYEDDGVTRTWSIITWGQWIDNNTGNPNKNARLGFCGYIYADPDNQTLPTSMAQFNKILTDADVASLPPLRYILPIPAEAISRSEGQYKNQYGY